VLKQVVAFVALIRINAGQRADNADLIQGSRLFDFVWAEAGAERVHVTLLT